jgi:hypothetical protein
MDVPIGITTDERMGGAINVSETETIDGMRVGIGVGTIVVEDSFPSSVIQGGGPRSSLPSLCPSS